MLKNSNSMLMTSMIGNHKWRLRKKLKNNKKQSLPLNQQPQPKSKKNRYQMLKKLRKCPIKCVEILTQCNHIMKLGTNMIQIWRLPNFSSNRRGLLNLITHMKMQETFLKQSHSQRLLFEALEMLVEQTY